MADGSAAYHDGRDGSRGGGGAIGNNIRGEGMTANLRGVPAQQTFSSPAEEGGGGQVKWLFARPVPQS